MNETAALIAALNTSWFASGLNEKAQTRLAELGRRFTAEPGTELFREGETSDTFGILVHGRVALRTLVPERGDITILTVEPGDVYLWSAIVPPFRASSSGTAIEPIEAILFEGAALRAALRDECELAAALYPRVLVAVARRLYATRLQMLDLFATQQVKEW
jgi:CRP/FNR family transcriptional regulator, cyclic AMP receptor protein